MHRRAFISAVTGGLLAAPLVVEAQQTGKVYRIGFIFMVLPVSEMARFPFKEQTRSGSEPARSLRRALGAGARIAARAAS